MAKFRFKPRKLSTLLRTGSKKLKRQITGRPFKVDENGDLCGCAIGAIAMAAGYDPLTKRGKLKANSEGIAYGIVDAIIESCHYADNPNSDVYGTPSIYYKNDSGMTFSGLANWLADEERRAKISCRNQPEVAV